MTIVWPKPRPVAVLDATSLIPVCARMESSRCRRLIYFLAAFHIAMMVGVSIALETSVVYCATITQCLIILYLVHHY